MRLVDFLMYLLEAQGETLKRLAAFFGEDRLLEMLEDSGENENEASRVPLLDPKLIPFDKISSSSSQSYNSPYITLEGAVHELGLPAVFEFHLWAYPYYRAFIESDLDLNSVMNNDSSQYLIQEAINQAQEWVKKLHIPPAVSIQAEAAAQLPWIRFRTQVLKRVGKRPMGAVT